MINTVSKLIFGSGYLGERVARRYLEAGEEVYVVTRSSERAAKFKGAGMLPIVADITDPASLTDLPVADTVLFAVGFDRNSGKTIHETYVDGLRHALDALPSGTGRVIYISSTGVYSQNDDGWVDEESLCEPRRAGGQACLDAERLLQTQVRGQVGPSSAVILRLAGIYGPDRIPRSADLLAGKPLPSPGEGYLNLIHVDDAAAVVLLADRLRAKSETGSPGQDVKIYCVSDGVPVRRHAYFEELARQLGAPPPSFESAAEGHATHARGTTSKRISNARLQAELPLRLAYPSYREGLAAIVAQSRE